MPLEEANSTWHPAFMPNASSDIAADAPTSRKDTVVLDSTKEEAGRPNLEEKVPTEEPGAHDAEQPEPNVSTQGSGDSWLGTGDDSFGASTESPELIRTSELVENEAEPALAPEDAPPKSTKASKHLTSDSFARTVSHNINWDNEDEDPEWSFPRTDTDPFKFMGPSDRTNSFPVVPPVAPSSDQSLGRQIVTSQADEIMAELDREASPMRSLAPLSTQPAGTLEEQDITSAPSPRQYVGGEAAAPEIEASNARYEEGVPLISQEQDSGAQGDDAEGLGYSFEDDTTGEDDFFNKIGGPGHGAAEDPLQTQSLGRKSTMQVMGSISAVSPSRTDTGGLEDMVEEAAEDDDFWNQTKPAEESLETFEAEPQQELNEAAPEPTEAGQTDGGGGDLAAKWAAAFDDEGDEDFLLDDSAPAQEVDPAAFFGDDDEGFLEDTEEIEPLNTVAAPPAPVPVKSPALNGRYTPANVSAAPSRQPSTSSQYLPTATPFLAPSTTQPPAMAPFIPPVPTPTGYGAPSPRPDLNKAASFADKSKGGYTSPYDLPMEIKPRKRPSAQPLGRTPDMQTPPGPPQPPRNESMPPPGPPGPPAPPRSASNPSSRPTSGGEGQNASISPKPQLQRPQAGEGFFADLPVSSRARPASRSSLKSAPSPQISPVGPPQGRVQDTAHPNSGIPQQFTQPPAVTQPLTSPPPGPVGHTGMAGLVAPGPVNPYAPVQSGASAPPVPGPSTSRYSPAPAPTAPSTRYSPAPGASRSASSAYAPVPAGVAPPVLLHQPRTSSPLAHFEISHDRSRPVSANQPDGVHSDRRPPSSVYNRVPSLPPTREVEEENSLQNSYPTSSRPPSQGTSVPTQAYPQVPHQARHTPPPLSLPSQQSTLSPPKRTSSYVPQAAQQTLSPQGRDFVPPPRSHTQSPSALHGNRTGIKSPDPIPRPSSVHDHTSPRSSVSGPATIASLVSVPAPAAAPISASRPRGISQSLNLVPPTDGREHDPLQRWKGAPLFSWGVGGTIVTSFPKDVPRYGINQAMPSIIRSPGEVRIKNVKDIYPLEERLAKFPGPLKGKSKKKETIAWLSTGIECLESKLPGTSFQSHVSHEEKRSVERVLLWKILRLFIEFDGALEGSSAVDKAVRDILSPGLDSMPAPAASFGQPADDLQGSFTTQMKSDGVDSVVVEQIRRSLLVGDREKAVWDAADKRLWGHALLIANTVSPDLYKKVSQEFVRKEVNYPGHNNEPLAVLYEVLAGSHEECVDELVPVHARAGLQLIATDSLQGQSTDALAGLDKWRETLGLILSNRSTNDAQAINSLGNLLAGYGRAEAAHICYFFARSATVFGGLDDPQAHFVLVGADHKRQPDHFAKETEALLLSEVYEYGLLLAAGGSKEVSCPHLAAYKLQHAMTLAENGYGEKASQYCETLAHAITSQTRRSPYHHVGLEAAVDNLAKRLRQAPKEESNSWISKPSMNKVSDSVWNRFNKFVAGDEGENEQNGSAAGGGIFAGVSGGTPTISRPPSPPNATAMEMFGGSAQGPHSYPVPGASTLPPPPAAANKATSRYAPGAALTPTTSNPYEAQQGYPTRGPPSTGRSSGEYSRGSPERSRRSSEFQRSAYTPYQPNNMPSPALSQTDSGLGISHENQYAPKSVGDPGASPTDSPAAGSQHGYQPFTPDYSLNGSPYAAAHDNQSEKPGTSGSGAAVSQGYQPPSYGYEPPSMTPLEPPSASKSEPEEPSATAGGYEPPSYQPYGYEPPSYQPDSDSSQLDGDRHSESRDEHKHSHVDDVSPVASTKLSGGKSREEIDRENSEMFRKAAEEDAKRVEAEKQAKKKGWFSGGWFGGGSGAAKKEAAEQPKAIRAKLGEQNSFYFDPELKRWVNKKAGADASATPVSTPPPPRSAPRSNSGTPPPPSGGALGALAGPPGMAGPPPPGRASAPPRGTLTASASIPNLASAAAQSQPSLLNGPPAMQRSVSNNSETPSGPPSRPATSMSNASSIDDLLSAAGPRKPGAKKARKSGRYVDVMAK